MHLLLTTELLTEEVKLCLYKLIAQGIGCPTDGSGYEEVSELLEGNTCIPLVEGLEEVELGEVGSL